MSRPLRDITNRPRRHRRGDQPPSGQPSSHPQRPSEWARIEVPFSLRNNDGRIRDITRQETLLISNLFPGTIKVGTTVLGVVVTVAQLPPRPRPVMMGDVPIFFTTDPDDHTGWNNWGLARPGMIPNALPQFNFRNMTDLDVPTCNHIARYCMEQGIPLHAIRLLTGGGLIGLLHRPHPVRQLPLTLGGATARWKVKDTLETYAEARHREVTATEADNSNYTPFLRPGVMISSSTHSATLGVGLTRVSDECKFVTAPEHAFPNHGPVWQARGASASLIGNISCTISDTDIALVSLQHGLHHTNETFAVGGTAGHIRRIGQSVGREELFEMDSPFDGLCVGISLAAEMTVLPSEGTTAGTQWNWVKAYWTSFSAHQRDEPSNGTCGTPVTIMDSDALVGFFRYYSPEHKLAYSIAASNIEQFFPGQWRITAS